MVPKSRIIQILEEIAVLLELKGENPFKSRAYENAARMLATLDDDPEVLVREGRLKTLKGVGSALQQKITELVSTGHLSYYESLKASIPAGHLEMLRIPGLGPRKIKALYESLQVETVGELAYACRENRLLGLPGFGRKTQEKILAGIAHLERYKERRLYGEVIEAAQGLLLALANHGAVRASRLAGSLRRGSETVKDMDLLVASAEPMAVADHFVALPGVESVTARGPTKVSVVLDSGVPADLRIVTEGQFPHALHHFTGSRAHNTALRGRARRLGLKMSEYGLYRGDENLSCLTEEEIFGAVGLSYIPPELREDLGEIEAAAAGVLPRLIEMSDIRGVFHVHTRASDGSESLEALADEALRMGLTYLGISDHSRSATYAGGLDLEAIEAQHRQIEALNRRLAPFHLFKGIEAEILPDGRLDYDEATLKRFDFVIAAVHSHFGMSEAVMTERVLRALANPLTTILAHPTGRLLLAREPYALDLNRVIDAAAQHGTVLELNAHPHRLDLDWRHCLQAKRRGVRIAINPDIHHLDGFGHVRFGVDMARKGWIERGDCLNSLDREGVQAFLSGRRQGQA